MVPDPRPELAEDSASWSKLLSMAYALPEENMDGVYGTLLGMRCIGARIAVVNGEARLQPGEIDPDEYRRCREKYLLPYKDVIAGLLHKVTTEVSQ